MHLTIDSLIEHQNKLEQQFQAASTLMQQTAGALAFINGQITDLMKNKEEQKEKGGSDCGQIDE